MAVKVATKEELRRAINEKQKEIIIDNNKLAKQLIRRKIIKKVLFILLILILLILIYLRFNDIIHSIKLIILYITIFIATKKLPLPEDLESMAPYKGWLWFPSQKNLSVPSPPIDLPESLLLIGFISILLGVLIFYALSKGYNVKIETKYGKVVLERK